MKLELPNGILTFIFVYFPGLFIIIGQGAYPSQNYNTSPTLEQRQGVSSEAALSLE